MGTGRSRASATAFLHRLISVKRHRAQSLRLCYYRPSPLGPARNALVAKQDRRVGNLVRSSRHHSLCNQNIPILQTSPLVSRKRQGSANGYLSLELGYCPGNQASTIVEWGGRRNMMVWTTLSNEAQSIWTDYSLLEFQQAKADIISSVTLFSKVSPSIFLADALTIKVGETCSRVDIVLNEHPNR